MQSKVASGVQIIETDVAQDGADKFEATFEYFTDTAGQLMIKYNGQVVGPAVRVDGAKKEEQVEQDAEWEKVGGAADEEWELV